MQQDIDIITAAQRKLYDPPNDEPDMVECLFCGEEIEHDIKSIDACPTCCHNFEKGLAQWNSLDIREKAIKVLCNGKELKIATASLGSGMLGLDITVLDPIQHGWKE